MRIYLAGITLFGLLSAGCTSDWDQSRAERTAEAGSSEAAKKDYPSAVLQARSAATNFASLPDRGELLRYSSDREVRRSGAYTLHPIEISEDHALNAIAGGELKLNTPDGKTVGIKYDRVEEHADGNWSWIGQNESGEHALFTFGEHAAFGEIFANGRTLRVVARDGGAWLMETNRAMLAGSHHGRRDHGPDFLIPPESLPVSAADVSMAGSKATTGSASSIPLKAVAVVDLAVGYTNGFVAAQLGANQSAAITRITYLVGLTNAAYQRSGVNMRIRLVNTTQVTFPDNTDNEDALQKLTGYNQANQQFVTPDAAFNSLRGAREEFGADLVALIRPHRAPEQNGCGIAWLIGANGRDIVPATHERFGFSVVSDGGDIDERDGNEYYCSTHSLAHELGHNMGQVHNRPDAPVAGRHVYSYGHRETSSTGFYTLMAYPINNSDQEEVAFFATPLINFAAGRPLGVAGSADNVRSMNETMPIIAQFRATVVPLSGVNNDFNGDGVSDILWRNTSTGQNLIWRSGNNSTQQAVSSVGGQAWRVVGAGDFNGDGTSDILWRNTSTGANAIWLAANNATQRTIAPVAGQAWAVAGVGDFNGDGVSDILWRNATTGANTIWLSGNNATQRTIAPVGNKAWTIVGVGDFNGDGLADILWRNTSTGANTIWLSGSNTTQVTMAAAALAWKPVGVGDFNGDGRSDIFWRNSSTGQNLIWLSGNSATQQAVTTVASQTWQVAGIGDFNGDGVSDVLWRNRSTAANAIWLGANNNTQRPTAAAGLAWSPVGF